jgi:hypothetical protein
MSQKQQARVGRLFVERGTSFDAWLFIFNAQLPFPSPDSLGSFLLHSKIPTHGWFFPSVASPKDDRAPIKCHGQSLAGGEEVKVDSSWEEFAWYFTLHGA